MPGTSWGTKLDGNHHLQAASGAFKVHRQILCVKHVRIMDRLRYSDAAVKYIAIFGSGHRVARQANLHQTEIVFLKFTAVGPPWGLDTTTSWQQVSRFSYGRAAGVMQLRGIKK